MKKKNRLRGNSQKLTDHVDEIIKKLEWLVSDANTGNKLLVENCKTYIADQINKIKDLNIESR